MKIEEMGNLVVANRVGMRLEDFKYEGPLPMEKVRQLQEAYLELTARYQRVMTASLDHIKETLQ